MKSNASILLCIILPFIINGEKTSTNYPREVAMLNEMARTQSKINNVLRLQKDGFLGEGHTGFVYQGYYTQRHTNRPVDTNKIVAIKFVPEARSSQSEREYEMYTYLNAFQKPEVEKYGIPTVYYYGKWENFTLTALTKLDVDAAHIVCMAHRLENPMDVLILMRDFIVQLKYIHSCGVRHDDINHGNIMVRGNKGFLIDFDLSSKMMEDNFNGTIGYAARRMHQREPRFAIDDLESFFYVVCHLLRCPFAWYSLQTSPIDSIKNLHKTGVLKSQTHKVLDSIDRNVNDGVLKTVIYEFAKEIYANPPKIFPDYNHLYAFVNGEISKLRVQTATLLPIFSWLTNAQKAEAAREIHSRTGLNIKNIVEPSSIDFATFVYPVVEHV